jgi:hypothetical protein
MAQLLHQHRMAIPNHGQVGALTTSNIVEPGFHGAGVVIPEKAEPRISQSANDLLADWHGVQQSPFNPHVLAFLQGGQNRGIGRGPTDPQ